ncbi:MAG: serine/threonine-protein kinase, partial [Myxococcota bacterium]
MSDRKELGAMIVTQQRPSHHHATAYREGQGQGTMEPFGPYLLLRVLGRGGMGVVYVARSRLPGHPIVALKRLRADAAQVPSFRERFEHECALALRLRHPRLVHVLDAGKVGDIPYIASELVLGMNVATIARRLLSLRRRAPLKIAVRVMLDMLAGLDYVHQAHEPDGRPLQLVHRDVTPGNVLVGYDGISRLADFGLAKSQLTEQLQLTATGMILGTPKFLAPEVAQGG